MTSANHNVHGPDVQDILAALKAAGCKPRRSGNGWTSQCPAHADANPSLSIAAGDKAAVVLHCHAGCSYAAIMAALGLNGRERPQSAPKPRTRAKPIQDSPRRFQTFEDALAEAGRQAGGQFVAAWRYPGDTFRVARFALPNGGKTFRPIHRNGAGWSIGDPPGKLPLYRGDTIENTGLILVVEGEKCADAAASVGLAAVTSAHGGGSAHKSDWQALAGREVAILPDNDPTGRRYAEEVVGILSSLTPPAAVKLLDLPGLAELGPGADIADWLGPDGPRETADVEAIRAELARLADAALGDGEVRLPPHQSLATLLAERPPLAEPIIHGLLRRGETATLVSASKARKSWTALDLAVAIATGSTWFDLSCRQGRALLIDCELQRGTLNHRVEAVLKSRCLTATAIGDRVHFTTWRGRAVTLAGLAGFFQIIRPGDFDLIALDPIYKLYPAGFDENSNADMASLFGTLQGLAERVQAALLLVAHTPKGDMTTRTVVDLMAGAGAAGRSVDVAISLRAHEASVPGEPVVVRECVSRSFPDLAPSAFRWAHPQWVAAPDLDPSALAKPGGRRKPREKTSTRTPTEPVVDEVEDFTARFIGEDPQSRAAILDKAIQAGLKERRAKTLLTRAEARGLVHRWTDMNPNKGARFATAPPPELDFEADEK